MPLFLSRKSRLIFIEKGSLLTGGKKRAIYYPVSIQAREFFSEKKEKDTPFSPGGER